MLQLYPNSPAQNSELAGTCVPDHQLALPALQTSFLLAGEPVTVYRDGQQYKLPPISNRREVDFGPGRYQGGGVVVEVLCCLVRCVNILSYLFGRESAEVRSLATQAVQAFQLHAPT
jgi:hypothetical protein